MPALHAPVLAKLQGGVTSAAKIADALNASPSSVNRALRALISAGQVVRIGARRGARYGLRRELSDIGSRWPLRRIGAGGEIHEIATLHSLSAGQYFLEPAGKINDSGFAPEGITQGLPYFLQDARPGGFLGRAVPARYPELDLPQRVTDWSDDHYLRYLTQRAGDAVGDLILGNESLNDSLSQLRTRSFIASADRSSRFPELATEVMAGGLPGSSAHGEHPKFTAAIEDGTASLHVIVKFSPPRDNRIGQRWADLLIAEHHAHEILRSASIPTCTSRIFPFRERTYLEMDRFDREGRQGRRGVTSLLAIDTARYWKLDHWIAAATRLCADRAISAETLEQVRLVATFGALIANTDRHFGNLAFLDTYDGRFALAPIYDMLPMLFAPDHDQIVARTFVPPGPTADTLMAWPRARALAERYWQLLGEDGRISGEFRAVSAECLRALESLPRTGAYAG